MRLARSQHGNPDTRTPGVLIGHGRSHDIFVAVFPGGRRRRVFTRLAAESGARPGDRVLDVGCGTGYFTRAMAEAVAPDGTAQGVDPSGEAITHARRLTRVANCTFYDGIAEALDAPDGSYDVVVSSLMIHHLPETLRPQAIGEMFRVLRPGGSVLIAEFRPPASRIGRHLIGALHSPAMAKNRVDLLEPMVREAGFEQLHSGDLRPWNRDVQALKPTGGAGGVKNPTAPIQAVEQPGGGWLADGDAANLGFFLDQPVVVVGEGSCTCPAMSATPVRSRVS
jgi:ubiquinone/menaquinone biosynthesis C-methylase UbiE